jgi:hypothetical protein
LWIAKKLATQRQVLTTRRIVDHDPFHRRRRCSPQTPGPWATARYICIRRSAGIHCQKEQPIRPPSLAAKILAKLVLDDPDIVFVGGTRQRIDADDLPTSKLDFDEVFSTNTSGGRLSCKIEIQSAKPSFHTLKIGVWDLLQAHQVWFKKASGRVKQTPLAAIGFWMNVHPGFASPRVFHTNIVNDIEKQYSHHPKVLDSFRLPPDYSSVEMYLSRSKIHAEYTQGGTTQSIDTDALMIYTLKSTAELTIICLTHLSLFSTAHNAADPMFILLAAKYHTPTKFGEFVARQNDFLNNHRNIAIIGLTPDAMDSITANGNDLWTSILRLPGVFCCDPCRRTSDLGKWNISCSKEHHPDICEWIDANLVELWNTITSTDRQTTFAPFPTLEQLSKGRNVTSASSVASSLTDASPVADYFRKLESQLQLQDLPSKPTLNVWKSTLPMEDISYSFDANAFPTRLRQDENHGDDSPGNWVGFYQPSHRRHCYHGGHGIQHHPLQYHRI